MRTIKLGHGLGVKAFNREMYDAISQNDSSTKRKENTMYASRKTMNLSFVLITSFFICQEYKAAASQPGPPDWTLVTNGTNPSGKKLRWVLARPDDNPINGTDIVALVIEIDRTSGGPKKVEARVWVYKDIVGGKYKNPKEITSPANLGFLFNEKQRNSKGPDNRLKRQEVNLTTQTAGPNDLQIMITGFTRRKTNERRLMCRIINLQNYAAYNFKGAPSGKKQKPENCDEPPTEDVLEEELVDPSTSEDPEYLP